MYPFQVSLVIPLFNESESLRELYQWINKVCTENELSYEIIFVDDGSTDTSWEIIHALHKENHHIKGIRFIHNYGKSAALNEGFKHTKGEVVITMDADLQDSPDAIPILYERIHKEGWDMISGWKKKRYDNVLTKNIPSKIFNIVTRRITGIPLHDFNCGLKAYKADIISHIEIFGEMHRYIPYLVYEAGFQKIGEQTVTHQARKFGTSKFGWNRFINGFLDLLTIRFLSKFGKRPMHFFGFIGFIFFLLGFGVLVYLSIDKLLFMMTEMTRRPIFYAAILACIVGMQLFLAGFIAEMIVRNSQERNKYNIREQIGIRTPL